MSFVAVVISTPAAAIGLLANVAAAACDASRAITAAAASARDDASETFDTAGDATTGGVDS
jgi:hypothetical protein